MKIFNVKSNSTIYFLNVIEGAEEVNIKRLGNKFTYYPINIPSEARITLLYKKKIIKWGDKIINGRNRNGVYVFISMMNDNLFAVYGDRISLSENEDFPLHDIKARNIKN